MLSLSFSPALFSPSSIVVSVAFLLHFSAICWSFGDDRLVVPSGSIKTAITLESGKTKRAA